MPIDRISVYNFKSIQELENFSIKPINILIGANGAGKTNFIEFFKLLHHIYQKRLQFYTAQNGYADRILFMGRKKSSFLGGEIIFRPDAKSNTSNTYKFKIVPQTHEDNFYFEEDLAGYNIYAMGYNESWDYKNAGGEGKLESEIIHNYELTRMDFLRNYFNTFRIFHFHDTTPNSPLKQPCNIEDNEYLKENGSNLSAFLYSIRHTSEFNMIQYTIQSIAPFFERFELYPSAKNENMISLNWVHKNAENYFNVHSLSDGTLRFIALTTLLLQPNPPKTIIIDEPELGLHPTAIYKLGEMIKMASTKSQVIVSTQSPYLVVIFEPEDFIVVERENNQSIFNRLSRLELAEWLEKYTISELWDKNIIGGLPR